VLHGERGGETFGIGDSLEVRVIRVDLDERKVDFERVGGGSRPERGASRGPRRGRRRRG